MAYDFTTIPGQTKKKEEKSNKVSASRYDFTIATKPTPELAVEVKTTPAASKAKTPAPPIPHPGVDDITAKDRFWINYYNSPFMKLHQPLFDKGILKKSERIQELERKYPSIAEGKLPAPKGAKQIAADFGGMIYADTPAIIASYMTGGAAGVAAAGARTAPQAGGLAPKALDGLTLLQREAARGIGAGAAYGGIESSMSGKGPIDTATTIAGDALLFGAGDPAFIKAAQVIGRAGGKVLEGYRKSQAAPAINDLDLRPLDVTSPDIHRKPSEQSQSIVDNLQAMIQYGADNMHKGGHTHFKKLMRNQFGSVFDGYSPEIQKRLIDDIWHKARELRKTGSTDIIFGGETTTVTKTQPTNTNLLADAFRRKINREPKKRNSIAETMAKLQDQFVDDVGALGRAEKAIRGGKLASAEDSLYKQARLFRGSPAKANHIVKARLAPIVKDIEKLGYNSSDLGDYALAVHAKDVNSMGINSGFSDAEIQAVVNKYGTPEMESARQELVRLSNDMLNELADAQVISRDLVQALRQKYPNYMPLFRSFDDNVDFAQGMSKTMANVASPIKKLKGSERDVIDPLESMVKNIFQITNAADRNRVALQLAKLAEEDTAGLFIRRLEKGQEVGRKNAVYARINGEKQHFEVEPEVYKSILQLDKESSNFLIRLLQKPASILRAGATLTPEFSLRNPARDIVQAYITSESGFKLTDFAAALFDIIMPNKKLLPQFLSDNAGFGNIVSMDRKVHREALKQVLKESPGQKFVNIINGRSLIGLLRNIADATETATKMGEYRAALRSGVSRPEAAYRARDVMDFARSGSSIREANKVVAFMNASIQGKSKLLRAARENPVGFMIRAVKMVTLPTVGVFMAQNYLANDEQKETIRNAPPWMRDTFWLIPIPGTNQVARIPKPFDLAPVFANLTERSLNHIVNNDPKAFDKFAEETFASWSIPIMITGILPFIEGMSNYSFFRQSPIIPRREENIQQVDQGDVNTTETAKLLAKAVYGVTGGEGPFQNLGSPRVIDHIILGLTAGLGRYATTSIDAFLNASGALEKPPRPAKKVSEQPLLKAFLVNENIPSNAVNDLYEMRDKLRREKGSLEGKRMPFRNKSKLKYIEQTTSKISDISKQMRQIENDPKMSPQVKTRRLDMLRRRRDNIADNAARRLGI